LATPYGNEMRRILPPDALPPAELHAGYAVDGLSPMAVAVPESRAQAAEVMRWAAESGVSVFPRGGGTKTALGNPPDSVGLVLDLSRLNRVIDYQPGDMTATVEAGITLEALQRELGAARQFVPLESPLPSRATVGGTLATAYFGPMANAYGPPRDWLIGIGVVGADGVATKAGGRVVKNVTGYDLNRLYTGSFGTRAVILEPSLKVSQAVPEEYARVAPFDSTEDAVHAVRDLDLSVRPGEIANLFDIRSQLRAAEWDLRIGPTRHAYFGLRMTEALRVTSGAALIDAAGRSGGAAISGQVSDWVDCSGTIAAGRQAGAALFPFPSGRGFPWFVSDWGTLTVNPLAHTCRELKRGDLLDLAVRVVVHDGDAAQADIAGLYRSFAASAFAQPNT